MRRPVATLARAVPTRDSILVERLFSFSLLRGLSSGTFLAWGACCVNLALCSIPCYREKV